MTVDLAAAAATAVAVLAVAVAAGVVLGRRARPAAAEASIGAEPGADRFRSLVAYSSDVVMVVGADGRIAYHSLAATTLLGWQADEMIGELLETVVHPDDRRTVLSLSEPSNLPAGHSTTTEVRLRRAQGGWCQTETTVTNLMAFEAVGGLVLASRDIEVRKQLEEQLRRRAFYDPVTDLGNRALFRDRLEHAVLRVRRYGGALAVLFIDLDGFKLINDTIGHDAGDQVLREVARRLRAALRESDTIARMGGDEFAVLLERSDDVRGVETVAGRILASLQHPIMLSEGVPTRVGCSIGVDLAGTSTASSADDLLRNADLAMYRAKAMGKGQTCLFQSSMRDEAVGRVRLEGDLRRALDAGELFLQYQPVVALPGGVITGCEALLRWHHPSRGLIPPSDFIGIAEDSGLIVQVGRWALTEACTQIQSVAPGTDGIAPWVSVNVATRQMLQPGLVQAVKAALNVSGLAPDRLILEITEGALLSDPRASAALLYQLRELGVRLAVDDFGTGYSSLSRLRTFAVDKLKIDRSFIQEIVSPADSAPIVAAVMAMAHNLGLTAVAEGVETLAQLACLHQHGCEEAQGFLLSRPLSLDDFSSLLREPGGLLAAAELPAASEEERHNALQQLISDTARGSAADTVPAVLGELRRRTGFDAIYVAVADGDRSIDEVVACNSNGLLDVPVGLELGAAPGTFLSLTGPEVPADLAARGVTSMVSVPVPGAEDHTAMLAGLRADSEPVPSSTVVLLELFSRILSDAVGDLAKAGAGSAPALQTGLPQ